MINYLEKQTREAEVRKLQQQNEKVQEGNYAQVHESYKFNDTINMTDIPELADAIALDDDQIFVKGTATNTDGEIWGDAIYDAEDNIVGLKNQPNLQLFITRSEIVKGHQRLQASRKIAVKNLSTSEAEEQVITIPDTDDATMEMGQVDNGQTTEGEKYKNR